MNATQRITEIVRTVTGDLPSEELCSVAIHEHLLFDIIPPNANWQNAQEITFENRWQADYRSNENPENARQSEVDIAISELLAFRAGGSDGYWPWP